MPNYDFRNKDTGEVTEKFMTIAQMETFLREHPEYEITFLQCQVGDPVALGIKKPPSDFLKYIVEPINIRNRSKKELRYRAPREV